MFEFVFKIWYMIAVLPFFILIEGSKKFSNFLKERDIYKHWDIWHSFLVILVILFFIFWINGYHL